VCDLETSRIGAPYIYNISCLRVKLSLHDRMYCWPSSVTIQLRLKILLPLTCLIISIFIYLSWDLCFTFVTEFSVFCFLLILNQIICAECNEII